ncbi:MAG: Gfo/Idh/MocA family oxidoreductase [Ruminococcaceae bacterium]|nr:Gfo/Idh/MocA family oxidoreductase [Oscillospiraceae bacterium]
MEKLRLAIIGQGRSGKNIHGKFLISENNTLWEVAYVVDLDERRRKVAETRYPGCKTFADYHELFKLDDIDLVVNSTYSEMHAPITKELLLAGKNVLVEKPFGRTRYECDELIRIAEEKGVTLAVFQQSFLAPFYPFTYNLVKSGKLGDIVAVNIRYCGFGRRWDWQTLQKRCAGSTYNTGPHPIGLALGLLDFDKSTRVAYSKLVASPLSSGDADDYAKILLVADGRPSVDIEVSQLDAYSDYHIKLQGTKGTYTTNIRSYKMTYITDGENPEMPVKETFIANEEGEPIYCSENLIKHTEEGTFEGDAFGVAVHEFYTQLYHKIKDGTPMTVTPEMAAEVISVIETVHAQNPLPLKF